MQLKRKKEHIRRKLTGGLLSVILIMQMLIGIPQVQAYKTSYANFTELADAVSASEDSDQAATIILGEDISFEKNLEIHSDVTLNAEKPVTLELNSYRIVVGSGAKLTIGENITVHQSTGATGHPIYLQDNTVFHVAGGKIVSDAAEGSVYVISSWGPNSEIILENATVIASSPSGRAVYTNTPANVITIENSNLAATNGGYAIYRGKYLLRGSSVMTGKIGGSASIYDFRSVSVKATPGIDTYKNGDMITLEKENDGTELAADCSVYYTVDGSDPRTSDTAEKYAQPFRVPLGTVVKATLRKDNFSGSLYTFDYSQDHDTVPGAISSVAPISEITVPIYMDAKNLELPNTILVKLNDSREKYVSVEWDTSSYNGEAVNTYKIPGTIVNLPNYISNPSDVKAEIVVHVQVEEISNFTGTPSQFLKEGKISVSKNASVLILSANGGDAAPVYSLTESTDYDNERFYIKDNQVLVKSTPLSAKEYSVEIRVTAGSKSLVSVFRFTVDPADPIYWISNPYEGINWDTVIQVKAALHNHTVNTNAPIGEWSDGVSGTVDSRIPIYQSMGYGAVAITDHDYVSYPWEHFGLNNSQLISIAGNELSKNAHMLSYFCTYFDNKGAGTSVTNGMIKNIENVGSMGGFLYIAHPNRSGGATQNPEYDLELLAYPQVRGIEVLNAGQFTNNHSEDLWDTLLSKTMPQRPIWGTASDDSHSDNLSTVGTGWTYLLLSEKSEAAAKEAMINGQTYFSSWRVEKGKDDSKANPNIPAPTIKSIRVDNEKGTIEIESENTTKIEWISENGTVVATGSEVNVNTTPGVAKYIRARLFGDGGQTMTQPFGLLDSTNFDKTAPEIQVNGKVPTAGTVGFPVSIPTAVAEDDRDGSVFAYANVYDSHGTHVNTMDNSFIPEIGGTYMVVYCAKDAFQNVAERSFTVVVPDTVKPTLSVSDVPLTGTVGNTIQLPEASATDDVSSAITPQISVLDPNGQNVSLKDFSFTPQTVGIYTVTYTAEDESRNKNSIEFKIKVSAEDQDEQDEQDSGSSGTGNENSHYENVETGDTSNVFKLFIIGLIAAVTCMMLYGKKRKVAKEDAKM